MAPLSGVEGHVPSCLCREIDTRGQGVWQAGRGPATGPGAYLFLSLSRKASSLQGVGISLLSLDTGPERLFCCFVFVCLLLGMGPILQED